MGTFIFERDCRTAYSESYTIMEDERSVGRIDLHFASPMVHGTLCIAESFTEQSIQDLIETIDEELIDAIGVNREEFVVHVFQGREIDVYSDHDFGENGENGPSV